MPEPIKITSLADLSRLVAESAFYPEPPLSERRAIHESGAWRWVRGALGTPTVYGAWEPAPFATCPAASYALEQRMRELGWWWLLADGERISWWCALNRPDCEEEFEEKHASRLIGMCLATLRALGVEFTLEPGWDKL